MPVNLSPVGGVAAQFFDNDGNVLSGGKIYTYVAGSSTPTATYTTSSGSIAHANPIILDSAGRVPGGEIWLTNGIFYKFVLKTSSETLIGTYDNIVGINSNIDASEVSYTPAGVGAITTTVQTQLRKTVFISDFGTGQTAVSACLDAYKGISCVIDGGSNTYALTSPISTTLATNVAWVLQNVKFTTNAITEPVSERGAIAIYGDEVAGSPYTGTNRLIVRNVTFTDNRTTAVGTLDGIQVEQMDQVYLENVRAKGCSNSGIFIELCRDVYVVNCDSSTNLYAGLRCANVYQAVVSGGTYNNNGKTIPVDGYGVTFTAGDQINSNVNLLVQGITANGNKRKAIDFHGGIHVNAIGNKISGFGKVGIYALSDIDGNFVRDVLIDGNIIEADATLTTASAGIAVGANGALTAPSGQFLVTNNIIKDCNTAGSWGIEIDANSTNFSPDLVMVSGNRVLTSGSTTTAPIAVQGSNLQIGNVKINDNVIYTTVAKYGIDIQNAINTTIDGNSIEITGGTVTMGINVVDSPSRPVMIQNNRLLGAATYTGTITDFISAPQASCRNNRYLNVQLKDVNTYSICVDWGTTVPVAGDGYYQQGSIRWNSGVAAGGSPGWVCTTSGVTGSGSVWRTMANVA